MAENNVSANFGFRPPEPLQLSGNVPENFKRFLRRYNVYMEASGYEKMESEVKVAMFLNLIGDEAHDIYYTFNLSSTETKDITKVIAAFEKFCSPCKNIIYDRFVFYHRVREVDEPFDHFLTDIKRLAKSCEFADEESMIRDRVVIGINNEGLQERLLRVPDLTLQKAIEIAQAAEISQRQAKVLQGEVKIAACKTLSLSKYKKPSMNMYKKTNDQNELASNKFSCKKCGNVHEKMKCPAFGKKCNNCNKYNHFAVGCFRNNKYDGDGKQRRQAAIVTRDDSVDYDSFVIQSIGIQSLAKGKGSTKPWFVMIVINGVSVDFKLDSGSDTNTIPLDIFNTLNVNKKIKIVNTPIKLVVYGGTNIDPIGSVNLLCKLPGKESTELEFEIVDVNDTPILGRESCEKLGLIKRLFSVADTVAFKNYYNKQQFINENLDVFNGIGCYPIKQKIIIADDAIPIVKPAYRIAESLKERLKETLSLYEKHGFIARVDEPTDWVHNLSIVEKPNGTLRLCLDPKEINKVVKREHFQIPTFDELTPNLSNKSIFTVLDLKDGFLQLELDETSSKLCTFHTPFGRFRFLRVPFGLASAPEMFHRVMSQTFGDIVGITLYFDDIVIAAENQQQHDDILNKVVQRAKKYNIKFNLDKLQFRVNSVKYLGQQFDADGISPDTEHVQAIIDLENPKDKQQLLAFMGMVNFVGKFIPNLSAITSPLRELLKKEVEWCWTKEHSDAVTLIKQKLSNPPILKCFDSSKSLTIQTDSSIKNLRTHMKLEALWEWQHSVPNTYPTWL